jgi:hypothetical protein
MPLPLEALVHCILTKLATGALAAVALAGHALAQDISISIRTPDRGYELVGFYDDCRDRRYIRAPDRDEECAGRYYGRPVPDRPHWDRHPWHRPISGRPHWRDDEDCRIIIKRRVNAWGDVVVRRIKVCD